MADSHNSVESEPIVNAEGGLLRVISGSADMEQPGIPGQWPGPEYPDSFSGQFKKSWARSSHQGRTIFH